LPLWTVAMDASSVTILEDAAADREVTEEEVIEYAEFLGIDPEKEQHLLWIARKGVSAPLPPPWKACTQGGEEVFYFNFESGESIWDHPCDEEFRELVETERSKPASERHSSGATADTAKAAEKVKSAACDSDKKGNPDSEDVDNFGKGSIPLLSRQSPSMSEPTTATSAEELKKRLQPITAMISDDESIEAEESSPAAAGSSTKPQGKSSEPPRVQMRPPELSLDFSGQSGQLGLSFSATDQKSPQGLGDTLELSMTADLFSEEAQPAKRSQNLWADIEALTRALSTLQAIRKDQREYLKLLQSSCQ